MRWPHGLGNWLDLLIVALFGLYCLRKARKLYRLSTFFDALGIATIAANVALGIAFAMTVAFTLYPTAYGWVWLRWSLRIALGVVVLVSEVIVEKSEPARVRGTEERKEPT